LPSWISFDGVGNSLQINAQDGDAGSYQLSLFAADPAGDTASAALTVEIADVVFSTGGPEADLLKGTAVADNLDAGAGDDRLYGYAGEDRLIAGDGADVLYGGQGNDLLLGGAGNDVLKGQAGADEMIGGEGDDRYYMDSPGDLATELADEGFDRVYSHVEHRLGTHFEDLILLGDGDISGTGNDADNRLYGNAGANALRGEDGDDRLFGRDGNDRLTGGAGNDVLNGQAGDDELIGGAGDDRYFIDSNNDSVVELGDEGADRVYSQVDYRLGDNLEDLILQGAADLDGIGNVGSNRLYGNAGANQLDGGAGDDRLYGREGDDRLLGGAGNDILNGQAGDDELVAGEGDDRLFGHDGNDRLIGGDGNDLLDGGPGYDAYHFGRGDGVDRIRRGTDEERLSGSDSIIFEPAIQPDQIWFSRAGNDLLAQLIGSADQIRISGWYLDAPAPVDVLRAGEGAVITADQVDQLVNAIAGFGVQRAPVIELSSLQQADYSTIVASSWEGPTQQTSV
jgi:Ca2+-binding RTX toxin-like protein